MLLVLVGLLGLTACGGADAETPFSGTVLENPYTVPDVGFTDTAGEQFSLAADTDERLTLLFFGYTRCEDVCPAVLSHLASAMTRLDEAEREQVEVVMVSSDPARDTPEQIREYLDGFDRSFTGLRADFETTAAVGREMAVGLDRDDPGAHTTQILAVGPSDQVQVYWGAETSPQQFASDIRQLLEDA